MGWKIWDVVAIGERAYGVAVEGTGEETRGRVLVGSAAHLPTNLDATTPDDFIEVVRTFAGRPEGKAARCMAEVAAPAIAERMAERDAEHWRASGRRETTPARTPWGRARRSVDCGSGVTRHDVPGHGRAWNVGPAGTASIPVAMQSPDGWYGREFEYVAASAMPSILAPSEGLDEIGLLAAAATRRLARRIPSVSPSSQKQSAQRFFGPDYVALRGVGATAENLADHGAMRSSSDRPTFSDYAGLDAAAQGATTSRASTWARCA